MGELQIHYVSLAVGMVFGIIVWEIADLIIKFWRK